MAEYLGPFELRGEIGRGAMAVVWRGYDPTLDREVALKEPFVAPGTDPAVAAELAARFIREGRAAARLNHPGIVTIYSAEVYDGRSVIAMELIDGRTLADIVDCGPLDPASTTALIDQLLAAVGYAHAAGVVHRDIKPDNVFVTSDGRAKLADFGIAHVGADASLTMAGSVMGTPGYMSPEQIAGQPVDARADLFAVGVMAHEMLTGRNPYGATEGTAATTVMYRIVHEPLPALGLRTPAGVDLDSVLAVATAKDPAQRFSDAAGFRAALSGGAVPTIVPGQAYAPALAPAGTKPAWLPYALVGGIGTLALAGLLIASGGNATGSGAPAPPAPVATATVPAAEVPAAAPEPPRGPTDDESRTALRSSYEQIRVFGDPGGRIATMATRFNNDLGGGVSSATAQAADSLCSDIETLRAGVSAAEVTPAFAQVKSDQLLLIDYCYVRADAIRQACYLSQSGRDIKGVLDQGRAAKDRYTALLPSGDPR